MFTKLGKKKATCIVAFMLFLLFTLSINAQESKSNFKIEQQSSSSIRISFNLGNWSLENKSVNGVEYKSINSNAQHKLFIDETETLPVYSTLISIPDGMNVELDTEKNDNVEFKSVRLIDGDMFKREAGLSNKYPNEQIQISEPGQFRDFRVISINIYPFQYDTKNGDLNVTKSLTMNLRFVQARESIINQYSGYYSPGFDNLYNSLILNYENQRDELIPTDQPVLLIIYPSGGDAAFLAKLDEFVNWKKQKGYIVNKASTSGTEAGNTNTLIKSYIQTAYNNLITRPDVVLFIGDPSSGLVIPTYTAEYGDYPYSLLTGGDEYGDVQLGRISVETSDEFGIYISKVMAYERDINLPTASWLNRMFLVGDSYHSGISTYYNNFYIREISTAVNPSYTYDIMNGSYGSGQQSAIDTGINNGVGFFNYRGYIGMSGWEPDIETTTNGMMLNHGVFVTCDTGTFYGGTSRTELYTRVGTDGVPAGGVTAIGMATSSTHTAINSFLCGAIFDGIFNRNMRSMGEALLFSRNYLQTVYGISNSTSAYNFKRYCNLMGDPTVETFVTIPKSFTVTSPATILPGTTNLEVIVRDASSNPVSNAVVNIWKTNICNLSANTDASGKAVFSLSSSLTDTLTITVSKHDFKPAINHVVISGTGLVYQSSVIDDDSSSGTVGNNNQIINAGETIDYKIRIKNTTSASISSSSGSLTCTDPYIQLVSTSLTFPLAFAGSTVTSSTAVRFIVSSTCPDNHPVTFYVSGTSSAGSWNATLQFIVRSPDLDYVSHTISGTNSFLEAGETTTISFSIVNNGTESATNVTAALRSLNSNIVVTDSIKVFGSIAAGTTFTNSANPFGIQAKNISIAGMVIPMQLYFYNTTTGYNDTEPFTITIGNTTLTDPLGQDAYGYFIYDMGDINYPQCPTYDWIEIASTASGPGTALTISDPGDGTTAHDEGDQVGCDASETVSLPFTFKYYGVNYNQITVVSNGFFVFGSTTNHDWRNGSLPGASGPNAMVAPFWDDLSTMTGGIYTYYDSANSRYIIEWYNLRNGYDRTSEETFQVILYDSATYPTISGDGQMKIQYKVFNNVDNTSTNYNHGNCSTIGLKDHTGTRGLEYSYNNAYPTAAKPLANLSSLFITTRPVVASIPFISPGLTTLFDTNSNGFAEPGETVGIRLNLENLGRTSASNVSATISENDPWITITQPTASYGTIAGQGSASNATLFSINVLSGCPDKYVASISVAITATGYTWTKVFTITIYQPLINVGTVTIHDTNANGLAEPGETVGLGLNLINQNPVAAYSVSTVISETDPWITITQNSASYGTISGYGNVTNASNFIIDVLAGCPNNYTATISALITSTGYSFSRTFTVTIYDTSLNFGNIVITDPTGNNNGRLDPGETVTINMPLNNAGGISSPSGSATMTSTTPGITINSGTASFTSIAASGSTNLVFSLTASSSIVVGTLASLVFNATAGSYNANKTENPPVGLIMEDFESGNFNSYPWSFAGNNNWTNDTSTFYNGTHSAKSGSLSDSQSSSMQTIRVLSSSGNLSFWYKVSSELNYDKLKFYIDGVLQNTSGWSGEIGWTQATYTLAVGSRTLRWEYSKDGSQIDGSDCAWVDDIVFPLSTAPSIYNPPQNFTATTSNATVILNWQAPATGTPTGYKIFKNSSLLTTVSSLTYTDLAVTNGTTYSYYLKAVYSGGESDPTTILSATPNPIAPTNLLAVPGISVVNLTWTATTGLRESSGDALFGSKNDRTISGYKVYRNGSYLATTTSMNYTDANVVNETTYSYYVTTVYINPAGESTASNTVTATPSAIPVITIGTGTETQRQPFGMYWGYERDAALYLSNEIGSTGNIRNLSWYVASSQTTAAPVTVRLATTTSTSLTATTWDALIAGATTVYTSTGMSFPTVGWQTITLSNPFAYTSGNLIILVETNYGGGGTGTYPTFMYSTAGTASNQYWNADNAAPTVNGIINALRPNIQIQLGTIEPDPVFNLSITSLTYGNVYIGVTPSRNFTITNTGGGNLSGQITTPLGYSVSTARILSDISNSKVNNVLRNSIPYTLGSGSSQIYTLTFSPTIAQTYNDNVTITSNDTAHLSNNLVVTGSGIVPVFNVPTSLTAFAGNTSVSLNWNIPTVGAGTINGYNIFRNSILITPSPITVNSFNDTGLTNGLLYSYYVTAVYTLPTGESAASVTVQATPTDVSFTTVTLGTGTSVSANNNISPINISYKSIHGQSIYTTAELNAAGIFGPINIIQIGFYVVSSPSLALPNFIIRMKHTNDANVSSWQTVNSMLTVYTNTSYMPTAGGYQMLTLTTPFQWNGIDNIVLDTAFSLVANWTNTGTLQYTSLASSFRAGYSDTINQTDIFTGGSIYNRRPNIKLTLSPAQLSIPNVTIEKVTQGVKISWLPVSNATRYIVKGSSSPNGGFTQISEVVATEYIETTPGLFGYYQIIAANGATSRDHVK